MQNQHQQMSARAFENGNQNEISPDFYENYQHLSMHEIEGVDYEINTYRGQKEPGVLIMAIHGGGIEPGTSEVARYVAGTSYSFYTLEGLKEQNNWKLHLSSSRFDEPIALQMVQEAGKCLSFHGLSGKEPVVYLGGQGIQLREQMAHQLAKDGFYVQLAGDGFRGEHDHNIVNLSQGQGVQLELAKGLRDLFFKARKKSRLNRQHKTDLFYRFVYSCHKALQ